MEGLGSLSKFPLEVVDLILDELCGHHSQRLRGPEDPEWMADDYDELLLDREDEAANITGLAGLCRASRQLNKLATWRLYHSLLGRKMRDHWPLIVRTLVERKDLALVVKHLVMDDKMYIPENRSLFPPQIMAYFAEQVAQCPDAGLHVDDLTQPPDYTKLPDPDTFKDMQYEAAVALMTTLCRNLSSLTFFTTEDTRAGVLNPPGSLPSLTTVHAIHWNFDGGCKLPLLFPLMRAAPNIRSLRIYRALCSGPAEDEAAVEEAPEFENLTDLTLQYCKMPGDELARILRLCPNLQRLKYTCKRPRMWDGLQFRPLEAAAAILAHVPNLQTFEFHLPGWLFLPFSERIPEDAVYEAKEVLEGRGIECKFVVDYDVWARKFIYLS